MGETLRRSETLSISIKTSFDKAWAFISRPENLHLWTVGFAVSQPIKVGSLYRVQTQRGFLDLFVKSNKGTGTIDFYFGSNSKFQCSPSRLITDDDGVIYILTQFEPHDAQPGLFEKLVSNVKNELKILKERLEAKNS